MRADALADLALSGGEGRGDCAAAAHVAAAERAAPGALRALVERKDGCGARCVALDPILANRLQLGLACACG